MSHYTIRDIYALPAEVPPCIVKIQDFDDPAVLQENVRDYVLSENVAAEMKRLVDRIVSSCVRHEAGTGHYLHGSFGSGKSHFMAILGLILQNNAAVWRKDHPIVAEIKARHNQWLAQHPILVIPVYMLGQDSLQMACYNAANARLQALDKPASEFSDAGKVIASFRAEADRYGDMVYDKFAESKNISRQRFDKMASGSQEEQDDLARYILEYRAPSRSEQKQLYPDKFSDGIAALSRHAKAQGFAGIVFMIDELILYLTGKSGQDYQKEFNDLVALTDNSALDRDIPVWVIVAQQRNIADTVPEDASEKHVREAMEHHKDRFPETTRLADRELVPIIEERVLRVRNGMEKERERIIAKTFDDLHPETRDILLHDLTQEDFERVYPFHPALIRTLIDVSARLSRERTAIRLLYELLITRHPNLPVGALVPYASLFDVVFQPDSLYSGSRSEELEAVRDTYYQRLEPLLDDAYGNEPARADRARVLLKTILLCGLSKSMRNDITVSRILHLNYQDLRGRTSFGSNQMIANILSDLSNRSELIHFHPNPQNPAGATAHIEIASGVQLSDVLKRVSATQWQRIERFNELMRDLLGGKPIHNGVLTNYKHTWRGTERPARVQFTNVAELSTNNIRLDNNDEFSLYIDYPFNVSEAFSRADDRKTIQRARSDLPQLPIGFWLPGEFTADDLRDLDEYAKMVEIETRPDQYLAEYGRTQRDELLSKIIGQKRTKSQTLRSRLLQLYKGDDARVDFLIPAITPSLDATKLEDVLKRIGDAVFDHLYPHHPRFVTTLNQRALHSLLEGFLVPAASGSGSVPRSNDLDGILRRLGQPLELAEEGANNWVLRRQSRYLTRLDELAAGKRVEADKITAGLAQAFGFTRDVTDTFILYLIKGQGYRALRGDKPAAEVDYGRLSGLVLEQGQRLHAHEWSQVKEFIKRTWQVRPAVEELTVAAQDRLWHQLNVKAGETTRLVLNELRNKLIAALKKAEVPLSDSIRLAIIEAAQALNNLASRRDVDAYQGLQELLTWQPGQQSLKREQAAEQIASGDATRRTLEDLQTDTIGRIRTLAHGGNTAAATVLHSIQRTLSLPNEQADIDSHVVAWEKQANKVIDEALQAQTKPGADIEIDKGEDDQRGKEIHEHLAKIVIALATLEIGDQTEQLDQDAVINLVRQLLYQSQKEIQGKAEVTLRIILSDGE
jgi:hypothetical protein